MIRAITFTILPLAIATAPLTGCQTPAPSLGFAAPVSAAQMRQMDSRVFDTNDEILVLNAIVALLQDLGYKVGDTDVKSGLVTAIKGAENITQSYGATIRVTVTTTPMAGDGGIKVRTTFQDVVQTRDPRYTYARSTIGPETYRQFYDRLSQSLFLEAQEL